MYTLNVFDSQGCEAIELYEVGCLMDGKLIPNAFISPNGDGANDTWIIENGWQRDDLHLEVFNRWGVLVFEHEGAYHDTWGADDRNGQTLPSATYFYLIRSIDESFEPIRSYLEVQGSER